MIGTYAPTNRARRILIAVLAFAIAIGFAIVALVAPAGAGDGDIKEYKVFIGTAFPSGNPATGNDLLVGDGASVEVRVTFLNPLENTATQQAGTFIVDFPGDFFVTSVDQPVASGGQTWVVLSDQDDEHVAISALDGDHRIAVTETVSVDVTVTVPDHKASGNTYSLSTDGDQQAGGIIGGGNEFTLSGPEPSITVGEGQIANCEQGQSCQTGNEGGNETDSSTTACPVGGCFKGGVLTVELETTENDCPDCVSVWIANTTTGDKDDPDDIFYLIIDTDGAKRVTIFVEVGFETWVAAKNCRPPHRTFNCVDTKHPQYDKKAGIYPLALLAGDPRGGWG